MNEDFAQQVREGLTATPRRIPCRFFYDEAGSRLFEKICELPEYYLPRAEREILEARAPELASRLPPGTTVFELGGGNAVKTRLVLEALLARGPLTYVSADISESAKAWVPPIASAAVAPARVADPTTRLMRLFIDLYP